MSDTLGEGFFASFGAGFCSFILFAILKVQFGTFALSKLAFVTSHFPKGPNGWLAHAFLAFLVATLFYLLWNGIASLAPGLDRIRGFVAYLFGFMVPFSFTLIYIAFPIRTWMVW